MDCYARTWKNQKLEVVSLLRFASSGCRRWTSSQHGGLFGVREHLFPWPVGSIQTCTSNIVNTNPHGLMLKYFHLATPWEKAAPPKPACRTQQMLHQLPERHIILADQWSCIRGKVIYEDDLGDQCHTVLGSRAPRSAMQACSPFSSCHPVTHTLDYWCQQPGKPFVHHRSHEILGQARTQKWS